MQYRFIPPTAWSSNLLLTDSTPFTHSALALSPPWQESFVQCGFQSEPKFTCLIFIDLEFCGDEISFRIVLSRTDSWSFPVAAASYGLRRCWWPPKAEEEAELTCYHSEVTYHSREIEKNIRASSQDGNQWQSNLECGLLVAIAWTEGFTLFSLLHWGDA